MTDSNSDGEESLDLNTLVSISNPYKVLGQLPDVDGIGVVGNNTASSGSGIGVKGIAEANPGVETSNPPAGVVGETTSTTGRTRGVVGVTDSEDGAGLFGRAANANGSADGIIGEAEGSGRAVLARGNVQVEGRMEVFDTIASVYKSSGNSQGVGSSLTKIVFDTEAWDDFNGYDDTVTSPTDYTVQNRGEFVVEAQIQWGSVPNGGKDLELVIQVDNGSSVNTLARNVEYVASDSWTDLTMRASKTLRLFQGDKVFAKARQGGSSTQSVAGGEANTYLTLTRIG